MSISISLRRIKEFMNWTELCHEERTGNGNKNSWCRISRHVYVIRLMSEVSVTLIDYTVGTE